MIGLPAWLGFGVFAGVFIACRMTGFDTGMILCPVAVRTRARHLIAI